MQKLDYLKETTSQTAGPYVHIGLAPGAAGFKTFDQELGEIIAPAEVAGQRIRVEGVVTDGMGMPVKDVLIEVWQADHDGTYPQSQRDEAFAVGVALFPILKRAFGNLTQSNLGLWWVAADNFRHRI